jgi:hypothetical protein
MELNLPSENPNDLDLGSIRTSWGKVFLNTKKSGENKWVTPNVDFDLDNLSFWEISQSEDEERTTFIPKESRYVIEGKEQPVYNPINVKIDFTSDNLKIALQDYGTVYRVQDKWSNLSEDDYFHPFKTLWKRLLKQISDDLEDDYSLFDRLEELLADEPSKRDVIIAIIEKDWNELINFMDLLGYEFALINNKTPETPETPQPNIEFGKLFLKNNFNTFVKLEENPYDRLILVSNEFVFVQPSGYYDNTFFQFVGTDKAKEQYNVSLRIHLAYERGIDIWFEDANQDISFSFIDITSESKFLNVVKDITKVLRSGQFEQELNSVATLFLNGIWIDKFIDCKFVSDRPEPKFAIGDKVVRIGGKQAMVVVKQIYDDNKKMWDYDLKFIENDSPVSAFEDQLEAYIEEVPEIPEKIIRKGEFFERNENVWLATEDSKEGRGFQYIVMESFRYIEEKFTNKWTVFWETDLVKRKFGEIELGLGYSYTEGFKFWLEKGNLKIKEDNVKNLGVAETIAQRIIIFLATVDRELSDEYQNIWLKLESGVESGIIRADWRTTKTDCEADPTKIVSSQVKRFYDLNKNRIDKLNPEFSCLIVKALVSLSDYESCGRPSSDSLPKPKNDLLSDIKNFTL